MIENKVFLGISAGIIVNIIANIIDYFLYTLSLNDYLAWHIAASIYFPLDQLKTFPALFLGIILDYILASIIGIIIVYILHYTGTDHYIMKAIVVGTIAVLLVDGIILGFLPETVDSFTPDHLIEHIIIAIFIAWISIKLGKETLTANRPT